MRKSSVPLFPPIKIKISFKWASWNYHQNGNKSDDPAYTRICTHNKASFIFNFIACLPYLYYQRTPMFSTAHTAPLLPIYVPTVGRSARNFSFDAGSNAHLLRALPGFRWFIEESNRCRDREFYLLNVRRGFHLFKWARTVYFNCCAAVVGIPDVRRPPSIRN